MSKKEMSGSAPEFEHENEMNGREAMPDALSPEARARLYGAMAMRGEATLDQELPKQPSINIQVYNAERDEWVPVGEVSSGGNPGSFSNNYEEGRDLYVFGVDEKNNVGYVKKSVFGRDIAVGEDRLVEPVGYEDIATLHPGDSYEMDVKTDVSPEPRKIRLTFTDPSAQP
jgi:hypothetical protein